MAHHLDVMVGMPLGELGALENSPMIRAQQEVVGSVKESLSNKVQEQAESLKEQVEPNDQAVLEPEYTSRWNLIRSVLESSRVHFQQVRRNRIRR